MTDTQIVFAIPEYEEFQESLCALMAADRGRVERQCFPDGECYQRVQDDVLERDVILVGGTVNDSTTLGLYDLACALVQYGARRLTLVVPYFGYSTMERASKSGEAVTAKTRARLLSAIPPAASGNRVFLLDLHSEGITHYFEGAMTAFHVSARAAVAAAIRKAGGGDFVIASTDAGRTKWVQGLADHLGVDSAFIIKRRFSGDVTQVTAVSAQVQGRRVVIYDDMIRTGTSLLGAANAYRAAGAREIAAVTTHGIFTGDAFQNLRRSGLFTSIVSTDSHPRAVALRKEGLTVLPAAGLFAAHLVPRGSAGTT
jgi:ribose-phosphate pyrophosphokinase